ncbi:hypothetical protein B0J18DRAFT_71643 [Chaetomium sp. MPI-SDFR-AT-0129]|nr:hypothetical protein B0J18DRAFT_71643 [Chaetomium sp. MPI-SDFR-AT-0129]
MNGGEDLMDEAESPPPNASAAVGSQTPVPRAASHSPCLFAPLCDACRARKIRCNRESPCAHCLHAKIQCTHSGKKPQEKRSRILLTHQYEQKIDLIDRRLDGVVRLLEELKSQRAPPLGIAGSTAVPSPRPPGPNSPPVSFSPASHGSRVHHVEATGSMVEGESSLTAHSVFANDLVHRVMSGGTSMPEMHERIETLRNMVEAMKKQPAAHEMTYPHAKPTHFGSPKGCDLPPIAKTLELLKLTRANPQLGIAWVFELFEMEHFPETCLALYMAEEYNAAQFITVNVGLHILFSGYSYLHREKEQEYLDLALICAINVETALLSLPLHLPANDDVIVALSFGVRFSQ